MGQIVSFVSRLLRPIEAGPTFCVNPWDVKRFCSRMASILPYRREETCVSIDQCMPQGMWAEAFA